MRLLSMMGARVRLVAPRTLLPADADRFGVEVFTDMREGLAGADIVMMLRLQLERMAGAFVPSTREYFRFYGLDREKLAYAKPGALVMHPGPMNRGVEIDSDIADDVEVSLIPEQVEMGVAIRMAVLDALVAGAGMNGMRRIAFRNARLVDPASGLDVKGGLLVENGTIADIGPRLFNDAEPHDPEVIDCRGLVLAPGLIDCRVFTGEPGSEHRETLAIGQRSGGGGRRHHHGRDAQHRSGDRRAVAGGFHPAPRRRHRQGARRCRWRR